MTDFRVVSAVEIADEIVRRLVPSEIPADVGRFVAEQAKQGERWGQINLGYEATALTMHYKLCPDGRIILQLTDCNLRSFWETTLRPAVDPS